MEEDLRWLKELNEKLWKKAEKPIGFKSPVATQAQRHIDMDDLGRVFRIIEEHKLVTELRSSNMFGGYGMLVYGPPTFPGVPLEVIFSVIEDNLPTPCKRVPGSGRDDAWEMFSKYTHSEQNRAWLKMYKMDPPRERTYYDY